MILVRSVFQVKFGHMDAVMNIVKQAVESGMEGNNETRMLTDASGQMFTLVFESVVESMDAYMDRMRASFDEPESASFMRAIEEHIESGRREFYNIEMEA